LRYRIPFLSMSDMRLCIVLFAFVLTNAWLKHPYAAPPFSATYVLGFWLIAAAMLVVMLAFLRDLNHIRRLWTSVAVLVFWVSLLLLCLWAYYSQTWAFTSENRPTIAQNATLQLVLLAAFIMAILIHAPSPRQVAVVLVGLLLLNSLIGGLQVALQGSIGLPGEFPLDPMRSGVSVIQSGDIRWLRPYGLLPHPNNFAGLLIMGLYPCITFINHPRRIVKFIGYAALVVGFWVLLLSFSRSAWLAFAIGGALILPLLIRQYGVPKRFLLALLLLAVTAALFAVMYYPLLAVRAGIGEESLELRSVADRVVYTQIAQQAITERPLLGLGAGNFPWYASYYLHHFTDYDLRGDHVHNVYLSVLGELGIVGLGLFLVVLIVACYGIWQAIRHDPEPLARIALFGGIIAFAVVSFFDYYPWILIHTQFLWFGLIAVALSPSVVVNGAAAVGDQATESQSNPHP